MLIFHQNFVGSCVILVQMLVQAKLLCDCFIVCYILHCYVVLGLKLVFDYICRDAEWNLAFNFSSDLTFLSSCLKKTRGMICKHVNRKYCELILNGDLLALLVDNLNSTLAFANL